LIGFEGEDDEPECVAKLPFFNFAQNARRDLRMIDS
jgi:hypothetical protein